MMGYIFFLLILVGILGGGYFLYVSAFMTILLFPLEIYYIWKTKEIAVPLDVNFIAIFIVVMSYLAATVWAVDSGMALMGFVKFFPVLLFLSILIRYKELKEKIIEYIPIFGCIMTILSFVMMQFDVFKKYVSVAGRLAGFFQYPNTYALFMLVCFIIVIDKIKVNHIDWFYVGYAVVSLVGIYLSGSRTVFLITVFLLIGLVILKKELRSLLIPGIVVLVIVFIAIAFAQSGVEGISRYTTISLKSSTFLGRLLYAKDAIPLIVQHPMGMGYYGYYFMQQQVQTGVYSVVNVHNEFLQIMLDVGVIPAILFYGALLKNIFSSKVKQRDRLILGVILIHSLFDYDLQFLIMWCVLLLFIDFNNVRCYKVSKIAKLGSVLVCAIIIAISGMIGVSDISYLTKDCKRAAVVYSGNTMAKLELLRQEKDAKKMVKMAEDILRKNKQVAFAYSAKARGELAGGNTEYFIKDKLTALQLAPYQYEEYLDYLESLAYCEEQYLNADEMESAKLCVKRAEDVLNMLDDLREKTSKLGWEIKDKPVVNLPYEYTELLDKMREKVNE